MIYIILFIIIAIVALSSTTINLKNRNIFVGLISILTLMSMFRYGSGTDYFGYMWHYKMNPNNIFEAIKYESGMNIGYRVLMAISKKIEFTFEIFVLFLAIIVMFFFIITILKNSKLPMVSLLVFYGSYYQIYINSALRQGIAMAIFIWSFFKFYKENKIAKYIISILFASLFHYSVLITLLVPIFKIMYNRFFYNFKINIIILIIGILGWILKGEKILVVIVKSFGLDINYNSSGANLLAILLRIILLVFILILYNYSNKNKLSEFDKMCIYFYFLNIVLFIFVCNMPILSRMTEYFSLLDIFIISNIIGEIRIKNIKFISISILIVILTIIFLKDQYSFLIQGRYYMNKLHEYPYVTIFNKDDIYNYREIREAFKPNL